ncbi:cytochrome c-type biogenesis protein CcmF [Thermosporothrix hazakensis]|uniref:Cytochrome c-type biogenesis protein CcmF n=1 Tax=Thermosporothrix hazakensis TaxID=644383 RepID=A0A326UDB6_THEHA|nr:heme lyase CcmF/NrfE family subunit [Thermosporothrix hazakensis]PZW23933.1 cytochrome c-type biogenesis protein CcmF [Thermosporothrix hazakensis]GCE48468.1 cytochrome c biogenesis protein CcmF [Thermosporothrix hazakensis]
MYFSELGFISLILAALFAVLTLVLAVIGAWKKRSQYTSSARHGALVVAAFLVLATAALVISFITHDFGVRYVTEHSSRSMPWYYVWAALYGGQEGSLLFWSFSLGLFTSLFVLTYKRAPAVLVPYVIATLMGIQLFLVLMLLTVSNPFVRLTAIPADGVGLNPLLLDPGMLLHPPLLLLGFMSFSLPYAFAVAAMISGHLNSEWLRAIRRWTLASWAIQSAGLLVGAWWAYHVLGWGGYWGWDPVENAALLPWLTSSAFLHSTMVQERRGMLKVWNLFLVIASFALTIFGTFEVRSGLISSVHSFAYSDIGGFFLVFLAVVIVFSTGLFLFRLPRLRPDQEFDSIVSREGVFLLNNFLLLGITFATLWGMLFPLLSSALNKQMMTVGPPFYNGVNGPLFALLILAMGVGPLLAWRRTSTSVIWRNIGVPLVLAALCAIILPLCGITNVLANIAFSICAFTGAAILYELWRGARVRHKHGESYPVAVFMLFKRYRQRYGGYIVHLGLVFLAIGVIASQFFQIQHDVTLKVGQQTEIAGYQLVFLGNLQQEETGKTVVTAQFQIWRDGKLLKYIYPGREVYHKMDQPVSKIEITTFGLNDLYVFLNDWDGPTKVGVRLFMNPLVPLIWYGGGLMLLGGLLCWWPAAQQGSRVRSQRRMSVPEKDEKQSAEVAV